MNLSDIFNEGDNPFANWDEVDAAAEMTPLPRGSYLCRVREKELRKVGRNETPAVWFKLVVLEGDHAGRLLFHNVFITEKSKPYAKRELTKVGIDRPEKLQVPYPARARLEVAVAIRKGDDGIERNRVTDWKIIGIDPEEPEPFAPAPVGLDGEPKGDAYEGDELAEGGPLR